MTENKERFLSLFTSHINRDGAKDLLSWLEETDFFVRQLQHVTTAVYAVDLLRTA